MPTVFKQSLGSVFLQLRAGGPTHYMGECINLDSISNPRLGGVEPIKCRSRKGNGKVFKTLGRTYGPPGSIDVSLTHLETTDVSFLEDIKCAVNLIAVRRVCGDAGVLANWERAHIVTRLELVGDEINALANRMEDGPGEHAWSLAGGEAPRIDARSSVIAQETIAELNSALFITNCDNLFCGDDCDQYTMPHDNLWVGAAHTPASAAVAAHIWNSDDAGTSWTPTADEPFAGGLNGLSGACFEIRQGVNRIYIVRETLAGTPLQGAYSDDGGTTWTIVNIGSTNTEAAVGPHSLMVLNFENMWVCTNKGNVYYSFDGGQSWADQGALTPSGANPLRAIHFADEKIGLAVGDNDTLIKTTDGGVHWLAAVATSSGDDLLCCVCFNKNRWLVGTDGAAAATSCLFETFDGGLTYIEIVFDGYLTEHVEGMSFTNEMTGFMITNTAGPVGTVQRTIDGGYSWRRMDTPANDGLLDILAIDVNEAFTCGIADGGGCFIGHIG